MKILIPMLSKYARHGGVTQFLSNFIYGSAEESNVELYDHSGILNDRFRVTVFGKVQNFVRRVVLVRSMLTFPMKVGRYNHVFLNPSLGRQSMKREMFYARCCVEKKVNFSVFFHGWSWEFVESIEQDSQLLQSYVHLLNSANNIFVLASDFKRKLVDWGVSDKLICLEKTTVNDDFIPDSIPTKTEENYLKVLFLARIDREKGVFEAVDAFSKHVEKYPDSTFSIAGDGDCLQELKDYVRDNGVSNVEFVGFADEALKRKLLLEHDVFLFPTYYPEGMPICIFEAMAYGLTIITRPVGGIKDYFEEGKMGTLLPSKNPVDYAEALSYLADNVNIRRATSEYNNNYAKENVASSVVGRRILKKLLNDE